MLGANAQDQLLFVRVSEFSQLRIARKLMREAGGVREIFTFWGTYPTDFPFMKAMC